MLCNHCGNEIEEGSVVCPYCGSLVNESAPAEPAQAAPSAQPAQPQYQQPVQQAPVASGSNGLATAGFVLALLGFNVIALVLSIVGLTKAKKLGGTGKGLAIAGIIISSLYMVIIVIYVIVRSLSQVPYYCNFSAKDGRRAPLGAAVFVNQEVRTKNKEANHEMQILRGRDQRYRGDLPQVRRHPR